MEKSSLLSLPKCCLEKVKGMQEAQHDGEDALVVGEELGKT